MHNLSNGSGTTFNDLEWPPTQISRSQQFLKLNIRKTARLKDKVIIAQEETISNIWNGTMFGDLDWPLNVSRGFVSISWASCVTFTELWLSEFLIADTTLRLPLSAYIKGTYPACVALDLYAWCPMLSPSPLTAVTLPPSAAVCAALMEGFGIVGAAVSFGLRFTICLPALSCQVCLRSGIASMGLSMDSYGHLRATHHKLWWL